MHSTTGPIHISDMMPSHERRDSFKWATWMGKTTQDELVISATLHHRTDSYQRVLQVCHVSDVRLLKTRLEHLPHYTTWTIYISDAKHSDERRDYFKWATWMVESAQDEARASATVHHMTHSYQRHDSFIWEMWLVHMSNTTRGVYRVAKTHRMP